MGVKLGLKMLREHRLGEYGNVAVNEIFGLRLKKVKMELYNKRLYYLYFSRNSNWVMR